MGSVRAETENWNWNWGCSSTYGSRVGWGEAACEGKTKKERKREKLKQKKLSQSSHKKKGRSRKLRQVREREETENGREEERWETRREARQRHIPANCLAMQLPKWHATCSLKSSCQLSVLLPLSLFQLPSWSAKHAVKIFWRNSMFMGFVLQQQKQETVRSVSLRLSTLHSFWYNLKPY